MPSHDRYPASSSTDPDPAETEGPFRTQEIVQFRDGETALGFRTPGDELTLGLGSDNKYSRSFGPGGIDMAWIRTESGRRYGIADGHAFRYDKDGRVAAYELPQGDLHVTIGRPLTIPEAVTTTEVKSVLLRYKTMGSGATTEQIDTLSPFATLQASIDALRAMQDKSE